MSNFDESETDVWGAAAPPAVQPAQRQASAVATPSTPNASPSDLPPAGDVYAAAVAASERARGLPTLVDAAEPVIQLVCRLNRAARKGGGVEAMPVVARQLRGAIDAAGRRYVDARDDDNERRTARGQWQKAREPLIYYVDYQMRNSAVPYAYDWANLAEAEDFRGLAGDEEFFRHVSADLKKDSPTAMERLMLYHECMATGFLGMYQFEPETVQRLMAKVRGKIAKRLGRDAFEDPNARVTPSAYEHNDETPLAPVETSRALTFIVAATVGLALVLLALTFYVYLSATGRYVNDLDQLSGTAPAGETPAGEATAD